MTRKRHWDPMVPQAPKSRQSRACAHGGTWHGFKERLRLARGMYRCEVCGVISDDLQAHHVVSQARDPSRVYDPANIQFLCQACHQAKHNR